MLSFPPSYSMKLKEVIFMDQSALHYWNVKYHLCEPYFMERNCDGRWHFRVSEKCLLNNSSILAMFLIAMTRSGSQFSKNATCLLWLQ